MASPFVDKNCVRVDFRGKGDRCCFASVQSDCCSHTWKNGSRGLLANPVRKCESLKRGVFPDTRRNSAATSGGITISRKIPSNNQFVQRGQDSAGRTCRRRQSL